MLAVCLRTSPKLTGIAFPNSLEEFRSTGYADDTTVAVTTDDSTEEVFSIYEKYERASGAKLHRGKSKGLWGATFSDGDYTIPTREPAIVELEKRLTTWSGRQLSFQGKTVVINTLALSQIWHLCHVFQIPRWAEKRINKAIWSFFWLGK